MDTKEQEDIAFDMKVYIFIPFEPSVNPSFMHPNPERLDPAYVGDKLDRAILRARQKALFESAPFNAVRKDQYSSFFREFDPEVYEFTKRN